MSELRITMSDQSNKMLESFKKVVDTIVEEEMPFSDYIEIERLPKKNLALSRSR